MYSNKLACIRVWKLIWRASQNTCSTTIGHTRRLYRALMNKIANFKKISRFLGTFWQKLPISRFLGTKFWHLEHFGTALIIKEKSDFYFGTEVEQIGTRLIIKKFLTFIRKILFRNVFIEWWIARLFRFQQFKKLIKLRKNNNARSSV